ncbi:hypothetical protein [Streptomyces sp. NPDC059168]|uniref:hypothetical protein n=1 Tax=Streptomyces sp. NPDC059168 TaxID=3346753 RepID=UPI00369EFEA0
MAIAGCAVALVASRATLDLGGADETTSVRAAVVAVIGLTLSMIMTPAAVSGGGPTTSTALACARERRTLGIHGAMQRDARGDRSRATQLAAAPMPQAPPPEDLARRELLAPDAGAMAVAGHVADRMFVEDSER